VAVLKFGAINFDDGARIMHQCFRCRFYCSGLSGTGWTQEQEVANRATGCRQTSGVHLVNIHNLLNGFILTYDKLQECSLKRFGIFACP
jgi:hypothetical protein